MGTRSLIGAKIDDKYKFIYCHWDGYPSHNGAILQAHYETLEKVEALLSLGDISSLDEQSTCPAGHSYSTPADGYTVAYCRDRGEDWEEVKPKTCTSKDEILKIDLGQEYIYLFEDDQWLVNCFDARGFRPLSEALIPDTEE